MLMIRVLGPLEVVVDGMMVEIRPAKERTLIALLASSVGQVVALERIVDALWHDQPPSNPAGNVQVLISRIRRRLGDEGGVLGTQAGGYVLTLSDDQLD